MNSVAPGAKLFKSTEFSTIAPIKNTHGFSINENAGAIVNDPKNIRPQFSDDIQPDISPQEQNILLHQHVEQQKH